MEDGAKKELPYDIMENILSRLPVKTLFRFKSVCKSWYATISDDQIFAGVHLRQSRNMSSGKRDVFFWLEKQGPDFWPIVSHQHQFLPKKIESQLDPTVLCYSDGLALRRYHGVDAGIYVLCNLSTGYRVKFACPCPIHHHPHQTVYGIIYDPLINDYKVIVIDNNMRYAVYQCRTETWSALQETNFSWGPLITGKGVSLNGDLYFILKTLEEEEEESRGRIKIVGFDPSRESFVRLPELNYTTKPDFFMFLTCLEGCMYVCINHSCLVIKVVGGKHEEKSWREFEGFPPLSTRRNVDTINWYYPGGDETELDAGNNYIIRMGYYRIPYLENLFISEPKRVTRKLR
ncbi:PREDICTED: putative F-box protein At3g22650 [Erythranthe guttata]|nr:PREDICTED: putative F-box protein At3g22650 [Erythranthe guttata]|eukprot:XP_012845675.1 PREDICTED: putative F-box protein At3g22650 [Erythranthe guttata]